jgi:hypothetical protein
MPSCRDIGPEVWEQARQALVLYFQRRQVTNFEDLAHDTLLAFWNRPDYLFERETDFLRVCYGFAGLILRQDYRRRKKLAADPLPSGDLGDLVGRPPRRCAFEPAELLVLLGEIFRIGRNELRENDWKLIEEAIAKNPSEMEAADGKNGANRIRVRLSRARNRLLRATGLLSIAEN